MVFVRGNFCFGSSSCTFQFIGPAFPYFFQKFLNFCVQIYSLGLGFTFGVWVQVLGLGLRFRF